MGPGVTLLTQTPRPERTQSAPPSQPVRVKILQNNMQQFSHPRTEGFESTDFSVLQAGKKRPASAALGVNPNKSDQDSSDSGDELSKIKMRGRKSVRNIAEALSSSAPPTPRKQVKKL